MGTVTGGSKRLEAKMKDQMGDGDVTRIMVPKDMDGFPSQIARYVGKGSLTDGELDPGGEAPDAVCVMYSATRKKELIEAAALESRRRLDSHIADKNAAVAEEGGYDTSSSTRFERHVVGPAALRQEG